MKRMWKVGAYTWRNPEAAIEAVCVVHETPGTYIVQETYRAGVGSARSVMHTREARYQKRHLTLFETWAEAHAELMRQMDRLVAAAELHLSKTVAQRGVFSTLREPGAEMVDV